MRFHLPPFLLIIRLAGATAVPQDPSALPGGGSSETTTPGLSGNLTFAGTVPKIQETTASMIAAGAASCPPVHMIVARASTELPGTGVIGSLALLVMAKQQGATLESVQYPALLAPYAPSSGAGTQATTKALTAMAQTCPQTKIVLMGYSQGAHIILDTMCGGGATAQASVLSKLELAPPNTAVSTDIQSKVVAIVQMGDPRKINGVSYNIGTSKAQDVFPRTADQKCSAATSSKIESYCDAGDSFCDSGLDLAAHLVYTELYDVPAAKFINDKIAAAGSNTTAAVVR